MPLSTYEEKMSNSVLLTLSSQALSENSGASIAALKEVLISFSHRCYILGNQTQNLSVWADEL